MDIIKAFGKTVDNWSTENPQRARWLLKTGWQAQYLALNAAPNKALSPADQYLAKIMMKMMLTPLKKPEQSAIVSIFTPCELLQEVGLHPYNVESYSSYLCGSMAERSFIQQAENSGLSETLCSYHKVFIGAAEQGLLPKPKCIVYTNLVCDANLVTFKHLAKKFQVPSFMLDVPLQPSSSSVDYVARQLWELKTFLEDQTGRRIDEDNLSERLVRTQQTLKTMERYCQQSADRCIPTDLASPMYTAITGNVLLGTEEAENYSRLLLESVKNAPAAKGVRLYWMHVLPFWSQAANKLLRLNERAQIITCDLAQACPSDFDPDEPYEAIAKRLVYNHFNGSVSRRIEAGICRAKDSGADGVVWFNHWGCKHTLGAAQLAKKRFEEAGLPLLILDGDGCDRSHGGEGQTATRLDAFLEMLEREKYA